MPSGSTGVCVPLLEAICRNSFYFKYLRHSRSGGRAEIGFVWYDRATAGRPEACQLGSFGTIAPLPSAPFGVPPSGGFEWLGCPIGFVWYSRAAPGGQGRPELASFGATAPVGRASLLAQIGFVCTKGLLGPRARETRCPPDRPIGFVWRDNPDPKPGGARRMPLRSVSLPLPTSDLPLAQIGFVSHESPPPRHGSHREQKQRLCLAQRRRDRQGLKYGRLQPSVIVLASWRSWRLGERRFWLRPDFGELSRAEATLGPRARFSIHFSIVTSSQ